MRPARWALGVASHSSATLTLTPPACQLLTSPTQPFRAVGKGPNIQPARRDVFLTEVAPTLRFGTRLTPPALQLILIRNSLSVSIDSDPFSRDFSSAFGSGLGSPSVGTPITPAGGNCLLTTLAPTISGKLIISPASGNLQTSTTAPIAYKAAPAAQVLITRVAPTVAIGAARNISPARRDELLTQTAPRVLPGRQIKPAAGNGLLTKTAPTVVVAQGILADYYILPAWQNHTFISGEQCQSGGLAYECITAGTSTAAPTGTGSDIAPGGGAHFKYIGVVPLWSGQFATNNAWIAGGPQVGSNPWCFGFAGGGGGSIAESGYSVWVDPGQYPQCAGVIAVNSGVLDLAVINVAADLGTWPTLPTSGVDIVNFNFAAGFTRAFGYYEFSARLDNVQGLLLHWDIEHEADAQPWQEINLEIYIATGGTHHVYFNRDDLANGKIDIVNLTTFDVTQYHTYGIDWQSGWYRLYIDGILRGELLTTTFSEVMGTFFVCDHAGYIDGASTINTANMPAKTHIQYYRIYGTKPS